MLDIDGRDHLQGVRKPEDDLKRTVPIKMNVIINPDRTEETYLEYLNRCFDDWGGMDMYKWCFDRPVGGLKADIMLLKKDGTVLGGSAVTYRKAAIRESMVNVAIMTGSWTLPESRRQGCFTRIIDESIALARQKGAALLLAFVTDRNASLKRLIGRGASLFPTHYLVSGEGTPEMESKLQISQVADTGKFVADIYRTMAEGRGGRPHFEYTIEEWRAQFVDRPEEIEIVSVGGDSPAIIEKKGIFDRILVIVPTGGHSFEDCLKALLKRTMGNGRRLFFFTTFSRQKDCAVDMGFEHIPGYLTTLIANEGTLRSLCPGLSENERPVAGELYDPDSKWYLGEWDLVTGDRM